MKRSKDHGLVMTAEHVDYSDMTKVGKVTIEINAKGELEVYSEGFEFSGDNSCRQASAKAMAWAREVLGTTLSADMLVPGGVSAMTCACD